MPNKTTTSRVTEMFLSAGIPVAGYLSVLKGDIELRALWHLPVIFLAAWHVIKVNDAAFGNTSSIRRIFLDKKNITAAVLFPFFIFPAFFIAPFFALFVFLTILNWDIYSLKGKRNCFTGLFHNFTGGILHFMIGLSAAGCFSYALFRRSVPEILFFAFVMTAGAMHHDSYDAEEDKNAGYITGAVRFSPGMWWRLAIIPFICGTAALFFCDGSFRTAFLFSSSVYFIIYFIASFAKDPILFPWFRTVCRLIFITGAVLFIYMKFNTF